MDGGLVILNLDYI